MNFCTYIFTDPKTGEYVYVGKGYIDRPYDHFNKSSDSQLSRLLKKRIREGFDPQPIIFKMPSDESAKVAEIFWIAVIGRKDLGTGTLFNRTNGGDGTVGRVNTPEQLKNLTDAQRARWQKPGVREAHGVSQKKRFESPEYRKTWSEMRQGPKNHNFGKCWINNGIANKAIPKPELETYLQKGYVQGMIKGKTKC